MFIAFEGPDGAGKSTQIALIAERLRTAGRTVTVTREPGGSPNLGTLIRNLVLHTDIDLGARAEALLIAADRAEHVRLVIEPALAAGHVVLCDRFVDSTIGYQGVGRGLPIDELETLCDFATAGRRPDLVVVVDLAPAAAATRQQARGDADRMEAANLGAAVRGLLLSRAANHPDRYVVIDADGAREQVTDRIWVALPWSVRMTSGADATLAPEPATATLRPAAASYAATTADWATAPHQGRAVPRGA